MTDNEFAPVTPGEMLKEEFLAEYGLSQNELAKAVGISPNRITDIVNNRRRITADTALRLGLYFGNSPEFWMNLQNHYDLKIARRNLTPADEKRIKSQRAAWCAVRGLMPSARPRSAPPSSVRRRRVRMVPGPVRLRSPESSAALSHRPVRAP